MVYLSIVYSTYMTMDIIDIFNFKEFSSLQEMLENSYQVWFKKPEANEVSYSVRLRADLALQNLGKYVNTSLLEGNETKVEKLVVQISPESPLRALLIGSNSLQTEMGYVEDVVLKGKYQCYGLKDALLRYKLFDSLVSNMSIDLKRAVSNVKGSVGTS
ncbi:hypothetical protein Fcan01_24882 [Folsomia candida]|uniref:Uncharacterized protein n=1 Tax=Folsomia candida TaxID=158441 RepID=A0A226D5V6_FOLCA|nr:hypothetical protein Fcan01_24882 [Folsomia candida]